MYLEYLVYFKCLVYLEYLEYIVYLKYLVHLEYIEYLVLIEYIEYLVHLEYIVYLESNSGPQGSIRIPVPETTATKPTPPTKLKPQMLPKPNSQKPVLAPSNMLFI